MALVRLNKFLSQAGIASRRLADELMATGRVTVNHQVVTALGTKVDPDRDQVGVDGRHVRPSVAKRYLLMNKPAGVVSTRSDPQRRTTVIDLVRRAGVADYVYPVGRLDFDSEGLLLLTNDGAFAERVTHPRYELPRTYEATVVGLPDERDLNRLRRGVVIDGTMTLPAEARVVRVVPGRDGERAVIELTLREGRNRQVRHMCDAIGHPVDRLRRIRIGTLSDRRLQPGHVRDLTDAEIRMIAGGSTRGPAAPRSGRPRPRAATPSTPRDRRPDAPRSDRPSGFTRRSPREGPSRTPRAPRRRATKPRR